MGGLKLTGTLGRKKHLPESMLIFFLYYVVLVTVTILLNYVTALSLFWAQSKCKVY